MEACRKQDLAPKRKTTLPKMKTTLPKKEDDITQKRRQLCLLLVGQILLVCSLCDIFMLFIGNFLITALVFFGLEKPMLEKKFYSRLTFKVA